MADLRPTARWTHISATAAGTTTLLDRAGEIYTAVIPANKTGTVSFYDVAAPTGTAAGNLMYAVPCTVGSIPTAVPLNHRVRYGCVAVYGGTVDMTVTTS